MALTHGELIFVRDLDEKLQKIQDQDIIRNDFNSLKNKKNLKMNNGRPNFITTVKKGVFLEPPPEVAALLGLGPCRSTHTSYSGSSPSCNSAITSATVVMYSYASKPKVLHKNYHTDCSRSRLNNARDLTTPYGNLMHDRRVIRGSTYSTHATTPDDGQARQKEARRRAQARRKARVYSSRGRQGTPPPVAGRKHEPVQTERFLEELLDRPPEADIACQTDLFLERPPTPMYVSSTGGEHKETQIYPGELFDWEVEVAPLIENIVNRALQQGLSEVLEEEELLDIQVHHRQLQEVHALEDQQAEIYGSKIFLRGEKYSAGGEQGFISNFEDILPGILTKLQAEGLLSRPQDVDAAWLWSLIAARLGCPTVIEELAKDALRSMSHFEEPDSSTDDLVMLSAGEKQNMTSATTRKRAQFLTKLTDK